MEITYVNHKRITSFPSASTGSKTANGSASEGEGVGPRIAGAVEIPYLDSTDRGSFPVTAFVAIAGVKTFILVSQVDKAIVALSYWTY